MKARIVFSFNRGSDASLARLARTIVGSLKDNAQFPNITNSVANVEKALGEYDVSLVNAGSRDRAMVSIKNDKQTVLRELLAQLAIIVTQISKGDKSMLLTSGFDINKDRGRPAKLPPNFVVYLAAPGEATLRVRKAGGIRAYVHQYTPDPLTAGSVWNSVTTVNREHTFHDLNSREKMWFQVIVIHKNGETTNLEPVARVIQ